MKEKDNKILVGVLCSLAVVIVGLVVGIVVVVMQNNEQKIDEVSEEEVEEECYYDEDTEETICKDFEGIKQESQIASRVQEIEEEVEKLLSENQIDIDAINALYASGIEEALQIDRRDYAYFLIMNRNDALLSKGMKREALDAMMATDFTVFTEPDQYRFYSKVIELAEGLNDTAALTKYNALRAQVEEAYMIDYNNTAGVVERSGNETEPEGGN